MKRRAAFYTLGVFALTACGGGGGSSPGGSGGVGPPVTPTPTPSTTTRQGTVVDDASNAPLSGVSVRLDPWIAYATPGPTPTPIFTTTTDAGGHFVLANVPNGTYLLVIGPDAIDTPPPAWNTPAPNAQDTPIPGASGWYATVHDRVVLGGGGTAAAPLPLVAPTLVPEPLYTPPASETSGNYRLAALDPLLEAPCILAYNQDRVSLSLPAAVADEWLTENTRAILDSDETWLASHPSGGDTVQFYTSGTGHGSVSGGANCSSWLNDYMPFTQPAQIADRDALWFGGSYHPYVQGSSVSAVGFSEAPVDPRLMVQGGGAPAWP